MNEHKIDPKSETEAAEWDAELSIGALSDEALDRENGARACMPGGTMFSTCRQGD